MTWKTRNLPPDYARAAESWRRHNPDWEIRIWDDTDIRQLVAERRPAFLPVFDAWPRNIQRADAFRIFVLAEVGGLYADMDIMALAPVGRLVGDASCLVTLEPQAHADAQHTQARGLPFLACNALMGSVPGHPFWTLAETLMLRQRHCDRVLDSTGPFLITGAVLAAAPKDRPVLVHPDIWSPMSAGRRKTAPFKAAPLIRSMGFDIAGEAAEPVTDHLWQNSWVGRPSLKKRASQALRSLPMLLTMGPMRWPDLPVQTQASGVSLTASTARPSVAIATPMKNAAQHLGSWRALIEGLGYPREKLSVHVLEGDSTDDTADKVAGILHDWQGRFAGTSLTGASYGFTSDLPRWHRDIQRPRRAIIAACRNLLLEQTADADYTLFLDSDVTAAPHDLIPLMLGAESAVTVANCVDEEGANFDLNNFLYERIPPYGIRSRWLLDGLHQPPPGLSRIYLTDMTYLQKAPLDCVGGTCLLIDNKVIRSGIRFPEEPFHYHIETEGFGLAARLAGFTVTGLPNVTIVHPRH